MGKKLIIAEKPSLSNTIQRAYIMKGGKDFLVILKEKNIFVLIALVIYFNYMIQMITLIEVNNYGALKKYRLFLMYISTK